MRPLTYLAAPFSDPNPEIRLARFRAANRAAGLLMKRGDVVYSPISHDFPIVEECGLPLGFADVSWVFWHASDRSYLSLSRLLVVLCIEGWEEGVGVQAEIAIARELGVAIEYMWFDGGGARFEVRA